ncbi:MAG: NAD(P)/FAD-dependent oxidoreductase [Bacteroidota bacterium]
MNNERSIAIIGAGLVGSLLSVYLAKRGYNVTIFEKRLDPRRAGYEGGRSINLALSNRGWWPLKEIGLEEAAKEMIIPMAGRMMHDESGKLTFQQYGKDGEAINSISRSGLNKLLMTKAERCGVKIFFGAALTDIDFGKSTFRFDQEDQSREFKANIIIGSDGAFSVVRKFMHATDRFNYSQYFVEHGYKELTIPPGPSGEFQLDKNALHIWPRGNYMLIALPNPGGSFTCTLFFPYEGEPSFSNIKTIADAQRLFKRDFPDAYELMLNFDRDFENNPTSSLVTIKCYPWVSNNTLLIGDASHAIVPFYGQGMNSGFEDCRVLNQLLDEHADDWKVVLKKFQNIRKQDADAISDLAMQNFIEMRDLVGDEQFLLRKKIEARLYDKYPERWIPLYSMVTFKETLRYSEALKKGQTQKRIMDEIMADPEIDHIWESLDMDDIVNKLETES